jgi:hypothetical protein
MHAQVGKGAHRPTQPDDGQLLVQQEHLRRLILQVGCIHHRMPEMPHRAVQGRLPGDI